MNASNKSPQDVVLDLFYKLTIVQRGVDDCDTDSNLLLFRIIHNMASAALSGAALTELKQQYHEICRTDFSRSLQISDELAKLEELFD